VTASLSAYRPWSSTVTPATASRSHNARPSPSVAPVTSTTVSSTGRAMGASGREGVELGQDVETPRVVLQAVLDLPPDHTHVLLVTGADGFGPGPVPDGADDLGARVLLAGLPDEGAVAHLGE